jgi:TubC N-terminal docking domain
LTVGAQALISNLIARGITLTPNGDSLIVRPRERLTDADREAIRQHKVELLALLTRAEQIEEAGIDRLAGGDGWQPNPAESIVAACQRYGVTLRIDATTGDLVVGKAGAKADEPTQPWPSLLIAIEAHLEAVASLVEAGWTLKTEFPQTDVA